MDKETRLKHLDDVVTNISAGDTEGANKAFHDYVTGAFKKVVEGDDPKAHPGDKMVRDTMKKAGDEEIDKKGESADDPKDVPGDKHVRDTMKKTGDEEIPKKGESADCPKDVPGDKAVRDTMKKAGDEEIKA